MQIFCTAKVKVYQRTSYRPKRKERFHDHIGDCRGFPWNEWTVGIWWCSGLGAVVAPVNTPTSLVPVLLYPTSPETLLQQRVARVAQQKTNMEAKDVGVASWAKAHKIDFKKTIQELQCELTVRESTEMVLNEVNQSLPWMGGSCKSCWGDQHYGIRA